MALNHSTTVDTTSRIFSHAAMTKLRKSSLLFHSQMIAAASAAIARMTRPMGLAFSAALSSHWAAVHAAVATFTATVAAFMASHFAGADVTMLMMTPSPWPSFPNTNSSGPVAAAASPILTIVSCTPGLRFVNQSARPRIFPARSCTAGAAASLIASAAVSSEPLSCSSAPAVPFMAASAIFCPAPCSLVLSMRSVIPLTPSLRRMLAARDASLPKMVCIAALRSSTDSPLNPVCNSDAIPVNGFMFPCASKKSSPSWLISFAASSDFGFRFVSIVLNDVPASDPDSPALLNAASAAVVSCTVSPDEAAAWPAIARPCARSSTSAADAFAAPARASVTSPARLAFRLNVFIAAMVMVAASAISICPAAARVIAAWTPPALICAVVIPPLASSSIASAASPALNTVSLPSCFARFRSSVILVAGAPVAAWSRFMLLEKSASALTAATPSAARGTVTPRDKALPALATFAPLRFNPSAKPRAMSSPRGAPTLTPMSASSAASFGPNPAADGRIDT